MRAQLCVAALMLVLATMFAVGPARAADNQPKTLFELLFKPKAEPKKSDQPAKTKRSTNRKAKESSRPARRNATAAALIGQPAELAPVEKRPDARAVLVLGDFFASGTAGGLEAAFAQDASVRVINAANGDSGLVRDDFYNWAVEAGPLIDLHKPAAVVVLIGANDRQQITVGGGKEVVRSPAWTAEYRRRVNALASAVRAKDVPLIWIGQLPLRASAANADMLAFNDIYRGVSAPGAVFVDVWDGFVDENGAFIERGPDINGQTVALRSGQVNVTRAGFRKIAFYAERELTRILGGAQPLSAAVGLTPGLGEDNLPPLTLGLPSAEANFARMRPVNLNEPDPNEGDELLGAVVRPASGLVLLPPPPPGRIDAIAAPVIRP
ncbi:MAG: DUF459 domain-containing protein [Rhizobiaceae bacterium]|jgi:hypothetical protein|nr:DUF459 domain-containing protein [Rhizobiaceae bacterium]